LDRGEQEQGAFQHGVAVIGWNELPDLSAIKTREHYHELDWSTIFKNVLRIEPPLVLTEEQATKLLQVLDECLRVVS
jgi:acetylornithine/succinyldiaminopimelate/putrescine aminotransferase